MHTWQLTTHSRIGCAHTEQALLTCCCRVQAGRQWSQVNRMKEQVAERMFDVMNANSPTWIAIDLHNPRAAMAVHVLERRLLSLAPTDDPCALLDVYSTCLSAACLAFAVV